MATFQTPWWRIALIAGVVLLVLVRRGWFGITVAPSMIYPLEPLCGPLNDIDISRGSS